MGAQVTAVDLLSQNVAAQHKLGTVHIEPDGNIFQYVKAEGASVAGGWVRIDELNDAYPLSTAGVASTTKNVGIACTALTDEYFGWVCRGSMGSGTFEAIITNGVSADTNLTTTASGGVAGTGGTAIAGVRTIDLGVTDTRVTVQLSGILRT